MGRPTGSRNPDFEDKREALAEGILRHLMQTGAAKASLRELAAACDVTPPTLRHYFGDREGALEAAFEIARRHGDEHCAHITGAELGGVREALGQALRYVVEGWVTYGVGRLHNLGISAGLAHERLGLAYVEQILEPLLQAFEARLARHVESGEIVVPSGRRAALQLVSPVVLGLLHQRSLGGHTFRPLDVDALIDDQVEGFLRAHAVSD